MIEKIINYLHILSIKIQIEHFEDKNNKEIIKIKI